MKLEEQVCSLELAKKLKELGVKQESLFYWVKVEIPKETYSSQDEVSEWGEYFLVSTELEKTIYLSFDDYEKKYEINSYGCGCCHWDMEVIEKYSAFTVAELGEILPSTYTLIKVDDISKKILYVSIIPSIILSESGETEAEARAKLLINLIKYKKDNNEKIL